MDTLEGHFQGGSAEARRAVEWHMWVLAVGRGEVGGVRTRVFLLVGRRWAGLQGIVCAGCVHETG